MRTVVIAEPGCTHEGDLDAMRSLVALAAAAGADVYKSQWLSSAERLCERRHAPGYLRCYRWLQFPVAWHAELSRVCREAGLRYACSTYLPEDIESVAPHVAYLKVSSFEAATEDHLAGHAPVLAAHPDLTVLVSMGMGADANRVRRIIGPRWKLRYLHCTSAYPAPVESLNLRRIAETRDGLSDHSPPTETWTGALAEAAGAFYVERHVRLDACRPDNPDYAVAQDARQFSAYVAAIRYAERARGIGDLAAAREAEEPMLRYRSVGA